MPQKNNLNNQNRGEIVIYKSKDGQTRLDVKLKQETVWLTQKQIAKLFGSERSVITKHLSNIFKTRELKENSVCAIFAHTAEDGKEYKIKFYNLDVIISVGYRVNSSRATQFRIWAGRVLREYLIEGYALNQKRLLEQAEKMKTLQSVIEMIQAKSQDLLLQDQAQELLNIISDYSSSLSLLSQYDEGKISLVKSRKAKFILTYQDSQRVIEEVKRKVLARKEAGELFGIEPEHKFQAIAGALYQTFGGRELYGSLEEKAANLLYLTIKDHPFVDGNKRIASILFIYFLECNDFLRKESGEKKINDSALTALALLTAISAPQEKDIIIKLITNLLKN